MPRALSLPPPAVAGALLLLLLLILTAGDASATAGSNVKRSLSFREAPAFRNGILCDAGETIHVAMTLDDTYLRGSIAGVLSVLQHSSCPENIVFHFLASSLRLRRTLLATFPYLTFHVYRFDPDLVRAKISPSVRRALEKPLNYARIYLAKLLPPSISRIIYFDSDLIVVDDVAKLWAIDLGPHVLGAPEYCHANFTAYFTDLFWSDRSFPRAFAGRPRPPCYFNTGVMVIDLRRWRSGKYTERLEEWMRIQKYRARIYDLGSLPPFLLVFAGDVKGVEHRWNQHGLGGDNLEGLCRDLHPGPVSLLHWSGKGKPWLRLDNGKPCPLDSLWAPYDLHRRPSAAMFADE